MINKFIATSANYCQKPQIMSDKLNIMCEILFEY